MVTPASIPCSGTEILARAVELVQQFVELRAVALHEVDDPLPDDVLILHMQVDRSIPIHPGHDPATDRAVLQRVTVGDECDRVIQITQQLLDNTTEEADVCVVIADSHPDAREELLDVLRSLSRHVNIHEERRRQAHERRHDDALPAPSWSFDKGDCALLTFLRPSNLSLRRPESWRNSMSHCKAASAMASTIILVAQVEAQSATQSAASRLEGESARNHGRIA
jgi:hypothetical protein